MALDPKTRERVIKLYREGKKTAAITEATGVPRSTIYYLLDQEGITPRRIGGPRTTEKPPLDASDKEMLEWAVARITELDKEVGSLRDTLSRAGNALRDE